MTSLHDNLSVDLHFCTPANHFGLIKILVFKDSLRSSFYRGSRCSKTAFPVLLSKLFKKIK